MRAREIVAHHQRSRGARAAIDGRSRARRPTASQVHEAQPGGARLEVADPDTAAAVVAAGLAPDAADPLEQQRAHGPRPGGAGRRLGAARRGSVPTAAERPRVARRRAEARRRLLVAASGGSRGSDDGGRVGARCGGHGSWNLGGRRRGPGRPLLYATRHESRRCRGASAREASASVPSWLPCARLLVLGTCVSLSNRPSPPLHFVSFWGYWLPLPCPQLHHQNAFLSCRTCAPNHFAWNESPDLWSSYSDRII